MESLSVTVFAAGRPVLSSRAGSINVVEDDGSRPLASDKAQLGKSTSADRPSPPVGVGTGLGAEAARAIVVSNDLGASGLTEAEHEMITELKARDAEVRRHEEAHARVGGQYAGQPSYTYQQGPDGKRYAIGGEVAIDIAPVPGDPAATIDKMRIVKAAALAPAEPSAADRRVAAIADAQRLEAMSELNRQKFAAPERGIEGLADILRATPDQRQGREINLAA